MGEEKEIDRKTLKKGFFKKVWNSITNIEKYPEMAAEGLGRAITYLCKIIIIFSIVLCLGMVYKTHQILQEGINYLENEFPEFSYKDGTLNVEAKEKIIISPKDSYVGKTIIDTNVQDEHTINEYINDVEKSQGGMIILKDKIILKNVAVAGTINYNYNEFLEQMGITEFNKQSIINYVNSSQIIAIYVSIFITIFIYSFILYFLVTLSNVVFLSIFGYLTTLVARIKMRFVAIFNMSIYAITLSIFLNIIYMVINMFINFNIEYFQVMYISVAAIYLVAAIFILKTEFMKQQIELTKIIEAQEIVRKEMEEKEQEKKEEEEKKETKKKDKEEEEKDKSKKDKNGGEPEGSNA